jgi:hypothetical protein
MMKVRYNMNFTGNNFVLGVICSCNLFLFGSIQGAQNNLFPQEPIKIIALYVLKDDIKSFSSNKDIETFDGYSYFLDKGFFKPTPVYPQGFNNLLCLDRSFYQVVSDVDYKDKLDLWYQFRTIIPHFPYEMQLLKHLIGKKNLACVNHRPEVLDIASQFFGHEAFFPVMFQQELSVNSKSLIKEPLDDVTLRPRGSYHGAYHGSVEQACFTRKELLCDWPFLFVTFYSNMLTYYVHADELKQQKIESYIKKHTPFGHNSCFTLNWFWIEFMGRFVSLLGSNYFQNDIENNLSGSELIFLIDCYSELNTEADSGVNFSCFGNKQLWEQLSDKQRLALFYYRHSLCLNLMLLVNSTVYVQDCLYLIEKWLKREYQDENLIIIDDFVTFPLRDWNRVKWYELFKVLPFLFLEINKNNIPEYSFFELLKIVLNPKDNPLVNWGMIVTQKRTKNLSKEEFLSSVAQQLLKLTPSFGKRLK